jgi:hypothetical protein
MEDFNSFISDNDESMKDLFEKCKVNMFCCEFLKQFINLVLFLNRQSKSKAKSSGGSSSSSSAQEEYYVDDFALQRKLVSLHAFFANNQEAIDNQLPEERTQGFSDLMKSVGPPPKAEELALLVDPQSPREAQENTRSRNTFFTRFQSIFRP